MICIQDNDNSNIQEQQHEIGFFFYKFLLVKRLINNKTEHTKVQHLECVQSYIVN